MGRIKEFQNPRLSLWQSAVDEVLARNSASGERGARRGVRPDSDHPIVEAATELASRIDAGAELPSLLPTALTQGPADPTLHCARLAMELGDARASGRAREVNRYREELDSANSDCDSDWEEVAEEFARKLVLRLSDVPYKAHAALDDFVLEGVLPERGSVALFSDWGTGAAPAREVLSQIAARRPALLIHLGDIYYSGTPFEIQRYFLGPLGERIDLNATPVFSLAGEHDMYSAGQGYYSELLPRLKQPASHFCLRNEHWQVVAIDTALHSRIPGGGPPYLETSEVEWLTDKLLNAGGRQTVLLSHHPLFSAYESIGETFYNEPLYEQLAPLLDRIDVWFWGHEHRLAVYEEFNALGATLKRGRVIGCGGFPVQVSEQSDTPLWPEVRVNESAKLGRAGDFYNQGYAILELDGPAAKVSYFQHTESAPVFEELLSPTAIARRAT
jgi:predicted phosphodiesterase